MQNVYRWYMMGVGALLLVGLMALAGAGTTTAQLVNPIPTPPGAGFPTIQITRPLRLLPPDFNIAPEPVFPAPQYATGDIFAIVAVQRANVRNAPSVEEGESVVVNVIKIGERYPVVGYTQEQDWWLLEINGEQAWVSYDGILVTNAEAAANLDGPRFPTDEQIANVNAQVAFANATVSVTANLNIRQGPSTGFPILRTIPAEDRVFLQGRNRFATWFLVNYRGTLGWVSSQYVALPQGTLLDSIPQVGG